ncbi:MAG TPA: hypothetical protein VGF84_06765 [Micromonosporaceae bacterium]|jgi:hypothetical protein
MTDTGTRERRPGVALTAGIVLGVIVAVAAYFVGLGRAAHLGHHSLVISILLGSVFGAGFGARTYRSGLNLFGRRR